MVDKNNTVKKKNPIYEHRFFYEIDEWYLRST